MPRRESYAQGTPNWVELQTADVAAAKGFYGRLFGWTFDEWPTTVGHSMTAACNGEGPGSGVVAAIVTSPPEVRGSSRVDASWHTYLAVDDLRKAVRRAAKAGGSVVLPTIEVPQTARLARVEDPGGAIVGLWEAAGRIGATVVNEPGAVIWNELMTDDVAAAAVFYRRLVGLAGELRDLDSGPYATFKAKGDPVAGACLRSGAGVAPHWHVYFAVDNVTRAAGRAAELGGDVLAGPMATEIGPMAALRDPLGALFSVFEVPAVPR